MRFVVIDRHPDAAVLGQKIAQQFQTRVHHRQPLAVFKVVVVMLESALGVVRRIDEDAFDTAGVERQKRLEGFEVVALDQQSARRWIAHLFDGIEKPVGHFARGALGFVIAEPGQLGHEVCLAACYCHGLIRRPYAVQSPDRDCKSPEGSSTAWRTCRALRKDLAQRRP